MFTRFRSFPNIVRIVALLALAFASIFVPWQTRAVGLGSVVTAAWSVPTQLTSIDNSTVGVTDPGDDLRYIDINFTANSSIMYWTVELSCKINGAILGAYTPNSDQNSTADNVAMATWQITGTPGSDANLPLQFNATNDTFVAAFTTLQATPIGKNGIETTYALATVRLRVKNVVGTSTLACTPTFLDTDGRPVGPPTTFHAPPALNIIAGYTITGQVRYQGGRDVPGGIGVKCTSGTNSFSTTTSPDTRFTMTVRVQGVLQCFYYANTFTHAAQVPDVYLGGYTYIALNGASYSILPVTILGGNLNYAVPTGTGNRIINASDLALITSNYNKAVSFGDINHDGNTDKIDLAILGPNLNTSESVMYGHVIYGLTSGQASDGSHIWIGRPNSRQITQMFPDPAGDNWPAVSPDGKKLIVTRRIGTAAPYRYALFIMNIDGSSATQLTPAAGPNSRPDDFAASWSPDGQSVGFNCSVEPAWMTNDSSLCVIDAAGANFRTVDTHVGIYPPAWLNNNTLVYGGNSHNAVCPNQICSVDLGSSPTTPHVYVDFPARMPTITHNGTIVNFLFADSSLEFAHTSNLGIFLPVTTGPRCDYYAVRESLDEFICVNAAGTQFNLVDSASHVYDVYDLVGNPAWNGIPELSSAIYALRNTLAFLP